VPNTDFLSNPVFVALDTPDLKKAEKLATILRPHVGGIKLGLEFFMAHGHYGVEKIADQGLPIFLDLKFHDIPNTVASAIEALFHAVKSPPAILTVHTEGGEAMMRAAKKAADKGSKVVGVTILTSLDQSDLGVIGMTGTPESQVEKLARLARRSGLDGIVCSGEEVEQVHEEWRDGFFVVPGIRPADSVVGDQKRVCTPADALDRGASILVIGRPITRADEPAEVASAIARQLRRK